MNEARHECPQTHFMSVGDREADVYDLFVAERAEGVDLLVRAAWDRRVAHDGAVSVGDGRGAARGGDCPRHVPRHGEQPARTAVLTLRFGAVELCPPGHRRAERLPRRDGLGRACGGGVSARRAWSRWNGYSSRPVRSLSHRGAGVRGVVRVSVWH